MSELEKMPARLDGVESQLLQLRSEMRDEFSAVRQEIEGTRREMRVLHEDVISRLALIQEGQTRKRKR